MSILVDFVRIYGFRAISNLEISLGKISLLTGVNNSGKTSFIKALSLALGDYAKVCEEDFYINSKGERAESIVIDVRIVPETTSVPKVFEDEWVIKFSDKIQQTVDGNQYVAIRTTCKRDLIKNGFSVSRTPLAIWELGEKWYDEISKQVQISPFFLKNIDFIDIDAQRDIHQELKEKFSFIGKILSNVKYDEETTKHLEQLMEDVNSEAVNKNSVLNDLKDSLLAISDSMSEFGSVEITPFSKKLRDFYKYFSVHFGDSDGKNFPAEYHGMGTRSLASILAVKAFIKLRNDNHHREVEPFFSFLATEEPEAHLHPNAQRTLYSQLNSITGQIIISTHSPYLLSTANIEEIMVFSKKNNEITVSRVLELDAEEKQKINRWVMMDRPDIIFSKALVLFEGFTERQVLPGMFSIFMDNKPPYSLGVSFLEVNGAGNYIPFVKFGMSFNIPIAIISDNDRKTKVTLNESIEKIKQDFPAYEFYFDNFFSIQYLNDGCDFEAELIFSGLKNEVVDAFVEDGEIKNSHVNYIENLKKSHTNLSDDDLLKKMRDNKISYSYSLSIVLAEKLVKNRIPQTIMSAFEKIKGWL